MIECGRTQHGMMYIKLGTDLCRGKSRRAEAAAARCTGLKNLRIFVFSRTETNCVLIHMCDLPRFDGSGHAPRRGRSHHTAQPAHMSTLAQCKSVSGLTNVHISK